MSMKIEGSATQSSSCEVEAESACSSQAAPPVCVDRLDPVLQSERAYAGSQGAVEERLYRALQQVPQPGLAELEMSAKALHVVGGKLSVTAEREAGGDYLVRVAAKGTLAVPFSHVTTAEARLEGASTMRFRTAEGAADYLAAVATAAPAPGLAAVTGDALPRLGHYAAGHLTRVELSGELGAHVAADLALNYGALDLTGRTTAMLDLERRALIVEQGVSGEAIGRASIALARAGVQGEVGLKARTELSLPREQLEALAAGRASLGDVLQGAEHRWQLVAEGRVLEEAGTLFAGAPSAQQRAELVFEPGALLDGDPATAPLHGERTFMTTKDQAWSTGVDLPGLNLLLRGAIYEVSRQPFVEHHGALQSELDVRRATTR